MFLAKTTYIMKQKKYKTTLNMKRMEYLRETTLSRKRKSLEEGEKKIIGPQFYWKLAFCVIKVDCNVLVLV